MFPYNPFKGMSSGQASGGPASRRRPPYYYPTWTRPGGYVPATFTTFYQARPQVGGAQGAVGNNPNPQVPPLAGGGPSGTGIGYYPAGNFTLQGAVGQSPYGNYYPTYNPWYNRNTYGYTTGATRPMQGYNWGLSYENINQETGELQGAYNRYGQPLGTPGPAQPGYGYKPITRRQSGQNYYRYRSPDEVYQMNKQKGKVGAQKRRNPKPGSRQGQDNGGGGGGGSYQQSKSGPVWYNDLVNWNI